MDSNPASDKLTAMANPRSPRCRRATGAIGTDFRDLASQSDATWGGLGRLGCGSATGTGTIQYVGTKTALRFFQAGLPF